ncbi:hypothetical protein MFFDBJGM_04378 [Pectobacterium versatile]|nr:hypothetical protein [Pectobacterium carotovorum subsp. carotovorum]PVY72021.1 hypothetical protein C7330_1061 [Pectobacterium versatile]GBO51339.1 hypothetical protein MFFDBJGM_04378 [Pectobacterium versatile]GKV82734.1 hypothetical protein PEC106664_35080 [Pectobacterium carotovorum subsp. carotovorum]
MEGGCGSASWELTVVMGKTKAQRDFLKRD